MVPTLVYAWVALRWAIDQFQREEVLFREAERFSLGTWLQAPGPGPPADAHRRPGDALLRPDPVRLVVPHGVHDVSGHRRPAWRRSPPASS